MKMDAERNLPLQRLAIQQSAMSAQPANLGSTSTSIQPMQRNIGSGILGGALAGASLAGMPGMAALGPWGALGGAALGGLLA